ncbi:MAG: Sec-independent protein translocase protein TatB [Pseudomonadota bacterium]
MFDIGALELLVIVIVAVIIIGPKDMPLAMRAAGRWIGKVRKVSAHFRTGIDAMVREAELEDMEKQWKARNEEIMRQSAEAAEKDAGQPVMTGPPPAAASKGDAGPLPSAAPSAPASAPPIAPAPPPPPAPQTPPSPQEASE